MAQCGFLVAAAIINVPANSQAPARTPYSASGEWTVTTYRAGDTGAFLRCSAERHYAAQTLTIAKNAAGMFVLGFTSDEWTFEDRSTHQVSIRVDSGDAVSMPGRVRILSVGPIVFVDLELESTVVAEIVAGNALYVSSAETALAMDLTGSAVAIASTNQCHRDAAY